ncbi:ABC transporter permease [Paenibacillus sp. NPDC056722]|uniref:ABC transporter permease n=1 Tax=Paenibacillus sp. NPDC056722 TaxID=3345924 RepID=UPI003674AE88
MLRRIGMSGQSRSAYAFPTAQRIFRRRLLSHWREQWTIIRTAADWTVLLYIIIPGLLLGGRIYYGYWVEPLPAWSTAMPYLFVPALLAILISKGGLLLFLQEGDLLFLRQRQRWVNAIMWRGLLYSLGVTTLKIGAVYLGMLPFIIRSYHVPVSAAVVLLILTVVTSWCVKLLGHLVSVQRQGWRKWLWQIPAIVIPCGFYLRMAILWYDSPGLLLTVAGVFAAATTTAIQRRFLLRGTFMNDVREDYKQRMNIASLLLRGVVDKPRPTRHKPWIFRRSQPLLRSKQAESRFAAAAVKALVRNPAHMKLYLSFAGVTGVAIFIVPSILKWLVFIVLNSLMAYWLHSFWSLFSGDDFVGILPFTKEQKNGAGAKAVPILLIPFSVFCAGVICLQLYAWWGLLLFIPVGCLGGIMIARIFSTFRLSS